jgi:hypothetical protein
MGLQLQLFKSRRQRGRWQIRNKFRISPDLMFVGPNGVVCWIELKAKGGRLSAAQAEVASHLVVCGHGYLCSSDYRDIIETLKGWGVLRSGISVQ